jgi:CRISPR-associated endoribonuclease Cas6
MKAITVMLRPEEHKIFNVNMGSLFHGFLMETISPIYGEMFHRDGLKPYTQYITKSKGGNEWFWRINMLTDEAEEALLKPFTQGMIKNVEIKNKNISFKVVSVEENEAVQYKELVRNFYLGGCATRFRKIRFQTPCAFRSAGQYIFFPDIRLIYQSLMNKFDSFSGDISLKDEEVLEHLVKYTQIKSYRLRSTLFHLEGVRIPSFIGEIRIKINGPETLSNLANLLLHFGNWAGVGIKTSLGMGAMMCE